MRTPSSPDFAGQNRPVILSSASAFARDQNPYLGELFAHLEGDFACRVYDAAAWRRPLPELFHVHWPEQLFRSTSPARTALKRLTSAVLVWRLRRARVPVVWTAHNPTPHEQGSPLESWLIARLMRLVNLRKEL